LMRKGFTWKLDQSMRIRIQVLLLEPSSLLMILRGELAVRFHCSSDASVIGLCGYIYKKFMVVLSAYAKVRVYIKPSSQRGGREHKNACFILRRAKLPMQLHHVRKTTNIHKSVFTVIDRESKIDSSDASGRMLDNVKGDIEHCHTLIVNTFSDCSRKIKYFALSVFGYFALKKLKGVKAEKELKTELITGLREFSYRELYAATKGFHSSRVIGRGAFGNVYRAMFVSSGTISAVKRSRHNSTEGRTEFLAELSIIACLRHKNLVQLQGWCNEKGELLLVYEFMPNGSLDKILYQESETGAVALDWSHRLNIAIGLASALSYLHHECEQQVVEPSPVPKMKPTLSFSIGLISLDDIVSKDDGDSIV
ncbi:hypothetical protein F2Q70_00005144, partial [Brassica cretica]